jgi:hypothetical protein
MHRLDIFYKIQVFRPALEARSGKSQAERHLYIDKYSYRTFFAAACSTQEPQGKHNLADCQPAVLCTVAAPEQPNKNKNPD